MVGKAEDTTKMHKMKSASAMMKSIAILWLSLLVGCSTQPAGMSDVNAADTGAADGQQYAEFSECALESGESIALCRIGYRTFGTLNADKSNAVLVPTWYTGTSEGHVYLATPEVIDPERYFVIVVDALGNGISSSPSNSETQPDERFPQITITDMINSQRRLLVERLEIPKLHAIVGLSMGGMQAFEWAVRYPDVADKIVAVVGSPRLPAFDIALWTSRNTLLEMYRECECREPLEALAAFSMTQLVPNVLEQEVGRENAVAAIRERAAARAEQMTIGRSWDQQRQAEAMIRHNVAREYGDDIQRAAARVTSQLLVIVGADDRVVTPQPAKDFAALLGATLVELDEDCGHGDPWCAGEEFSGLVRGFLSPS
jgi:homoserine O-acetyltransferase